MSPLPLLIQTVYLHDDDRAVAERIGKQLYERLNRPSSDRLSFGSGIAVRIACTKEHVLTEPAQRTVVVPVLGGRLYQRDKGEVKALLLEWLKKPGITLLVVPKVDGWRTLEDKDFPALMLQSLYAADQETSTLAEVLLAVGRALDGGPNSKGGIHLFLSHAKVDKSTAAQAAKDIHGYIATHTTGQAFFDQVDVKPAVSLGLQIDEAVSKSVLVILRSDNYSSRTWCKAEVLSAKKQGVATLVVEVLERGELRTLPYVGNCASMCWNKDVDNVSEIVLRAAAEWIKARYFLLEVERLCTFIDLPDNSRGVVRPPELLDLAQGPLDAKGPTLAVYPDPELSLAERNVLRAIRPQLRFATPTSVYRRVLDASEKLGLDQPLSLKSIAFSLSTSPDEGGPEGYTTEHVVDATVHVARTLIAAGAGIAYGGDFSVERDPNYTFLLQELIATYNQAADSQAPKLESFLGVPLSPPESFPAFIHSLREPELLLRTRPLLPPTPEELAGTISEARSGLFFCDMRRVMGHETFARVLIGGAAKPKDKDKKGFAGPFPGVLEEAWRTLEAKRPLYVVGGFGGVAKDVADLLQGKDAPRVSHAGLCNEPLYSPRLAAMRQDPGYDLLGLPPTMDELAKLIGEFGKQLLDDDSLNGLTREENLELFASRDLVRIAGLIMKGLLRVVAAESKGKQRIELVRDDITRARRAGAVAVGVFHGIEAEGPGKALDSVLSGRLSLARSANQRLVSLPGEALDAHWLYLADLGPMIQDQIEAAVERAARQTLEVMSARGIKRLAFVTYGGNTIQFLDAAKAMLAGFEKAGKTDTTLVWYERDATRFAALRDLILPKDRFEPSVPDAMVTTIENENVGDVPSDEKRSWVSVSWSGEVITTTIVIPGAAVAPVIKMPMTAARLKELSRGSYGAAPELPDIDTRGEAIANEVLGPKGIALLEARGDLPMMLVHDLESSRIPFETLRINTRRPSLDNALVRRPALENIWPDRLVDRPGTKGKLKVKIIVDPTETLKHARREGDAVRAQLEKNDSVTVLEPLLGKAGTVANVLEAFKDTEVDVIHFIGHAFYKGTGPTQSGLLCADNERLTRADLVDARVQPRLVFMNACESARVRSEDEFQVPLMSFAEMFLRGGVESYIGAFWEVVDTSAATFADAMYGALADAKPLYAAVAAGRRALMDAKSPDWANYVLYGDGALCLRSKKRRG